jgi:hypothetical protein
MNVEGTRETKLHASEGQGCRAKSAGLDLRLSTCGIMFEFDQIRPIWRSRGYLLQRRDTDAVLSSVIHPSFQGQSEIAS